MSYILRLTFVCAACFFLLHLAIGLVVWALSPLAVRLAVRMRRPASGARLLLGLRLLPLTVSLLSVAAFCIPSYLRYEQYGAESVGLVCSAFAGCGLVLLAAAVARFAWALVVSSRLLTQPAGVADQLAADRSLFALVGFLRPRLVISPAIRDMLSRSQMEAALLHEEAHRDAHDNLKRLALIASPSLVPFLNSFRALETNWARLSEWAADDAAVDAHPLRAIALAEALVRVARLSSCPPVYAAASTLVASKDDLGERVQRLLHLPQTALPRRSRYSRSFATCSAAAAALALLILAPHQQHLLYAVHCAMESLVR